MIVKHDCLICNSENILINGKCQPYLFTANDKIDKNNQIIGLKWKIITIYKCNGFK